jgi:phenylacetate-CoA ligase
MNLRLDKMRSHLFWLCHKAGKTALLRHYNDIQSFFAASDAVREVTTRRNLERILRHAINTVPFYKRVLDDLELSAFPVTNKNQIRSQQNAFLSSSLPPKSSTRMITSGSTGTPFVVYHDEDKRARNAADTLYFAQLTGYSVGDRLFYLKIWSAYNHKSRLSQWLQNISPIDVVSFNDSEIEFLLHTIDTTQESYAFLGYSSAVERICCYLEKSSREPFKHRPSSAITMSESLNDRTKASFQRYFGTPLFSRYSNIENGIIAQQTPESGHRFLINSASYHVELLSLTEDKPAKPGELGRIVITDFFNLQMPLIRYDTGDTGILAHESGDEPFRYFDVVEGRKMDLLYATDGSLVSSFVVYKNMWQYTEIEQYQLEQFGRVDYLIRITAKNPIAKEPQLIAEFKSFLGRDANIQIEYNNEIPLLASGKRKKIINTYRQSGS